MVRPDGGTRTECGRQGFGPPRAGFDDQQAQGIVYVLSDLATQSQVEDLKQDLAQIRSDLTREIGEVRTEVHRELHNLWWKLAGVLFLQAGFIVSLIKLI